MMTTLWRRGGPRRPALRARRGHGSRRMVQGLARGLDLMVRRLKRWSSSPPPVGFPAPRRHRAWGGVWGSGLAVVLLAATAAPAHAGWFCPWFGGPYCFTRLMDVACSPGAQQSTVHVAYTLQNGRAFDGEGAAPCGPSFVLHQFDNAAEDGYQTALWRNIKVRGGGRLLTACQTVWEAGNVHGEQTVVCAGGGESVTVTVHPAE